MSISNEDLLFGLFEHFPQGCIVYKLERDDQGLIVDWTVAFVNSGASMTMGMTPAQMVGKSALALYGKEFFEPYLEMSRVVNATQVCQEQELFFDVSGRYYLSTLFYVDADHVGNTNYDITSRVLIEKEKERLLSEIHSKNQDLESLIHTLSHDVKAPLVNMHSFTKELDIVIDDLRKKLPPRGCEDALEELQDCSKWIACSAERMGNVANGVIRYARLGRMEFTIKSVDLASIINKVQESEKGRLGEVSGKIKMGDLPVCSGDAELLAQVFANLIDNSIKYRRTESNLLITIDGRVEGDTVFIVYTDNGQGIAKDYRDKVFEIFHRLDPQGSVPGEGMGLTLVRRSLSRMSGCIEIADGPQGGGCTFLIRLPKG